MRRLLGTIVLLMQACCAPAPVTAADVPQRAQQYLPILVKVQSDVWPDAPMPSFMAAQVEQESCITLKHSKCWNPRVELKTSREYGFGLGQTTIAYNADGGVRFDKWSELRRRHASLAGWTWENRFDPHYQLTALVEMDHGIYRRVAGANSATDQLAFTLSAYNGGESGVRQDRLLCRNVSACNPGAWFGNVEKHSLKRKTPFKGYGASPFQINREYVRNVIEVRRPKYEPFFGG